MAALTGRPGTGRSLALLVILVLVTTAVVATPALAVDTPDTYFYVSAIGNPYAPGLNFATNAPAGIATDNNGNVYVTLPIGFAKFNAAGTHMCTYTGEAGWYTPSWGYGIDVDSNGNVYFADSTKNRIAKLHPSSNGLSGTVYNMVSLTGRNSYTTGDTGLGHGEFDFPVDVAVDGHYLYVADKNNNRIQKFETATGDNTLSWVWNLGKGTGDGTHGNLNGEFYLPTGVAADGNGHIFVADSGNHRIQEFTTNGVFVAKWGVSTPSTDPLYMLGPNGIDADADGGVYTTNWDATYAVVNKYRYNGTAWERVTSLGSKGTGNSQFTNPWNLATAPNGYLWVADYQGQKIKKFARDATPPEIHGAGFPTGWTNTINHPELIATDPTVAGQYTSGVVDTFYSKTGGAPWTTYLEPFAPSDFPTDGHTALTYYAQDAVGNSSTPATIDLYLDRIAPVTTASEPTDLWHSAPVTVTLNPTDAVSGVAATYWKIEVVGDENAQKVWTAGTSVTAGVYRRGAPRSGIFRISYYSVDNAGNKGTVQSIIVKVDVDGPVTTNDFDGLTHSTDAIIHFSAIDAGVGTIGTIYSNIDGGSFAAGNSRTVPAPANHSNDGVHYVAYYSTDSLGNRGRQQVVAVTIKAPGASSPITAPSLQTLSTARGRPHDGRRAVARHRMRHAWWALR